jgi:hypothetical protein
MGTLASQVVDVSHYVRSYLAATGVMTSASGWRFRGTAARDCYPSWIGPIWAPYRSEKVASADDCTRRRVGNDRAIPADHCDVIHMA